MIHSHYWLSGQVGWLARDRWGVPLVHSAHTLAKVKNDALAEGDAPEPLARGDRRGAGGRRGRPADRLDRGGGRPAGRALRRRPAPRSTSCRPASTSTGSRPARARSARRALGLRPDDLVLLFVGRIQPLKAPDVLLRAVAELRADAPELARRVQVVVVGAPSGSGLADPNWLQHLAEQLGIGAHVRFVGRSDGPSWPTTTGPPT